MSKNKNVVVTKPTEIVENVVVENVAEIVAKPITDPFVPCGTYLECCEMLETVVSDESAKLSGKMSELLTEKTNFIVGELKLTDDETNAIVEKTKTEIAEMVKKQPTLVVDFEKLKNQNVSNAQILKLQTFQTNAIIIETELQNVAQCWKKSPSFVKCMVSEIVKTMPRFIVGLQSDLEKLKSELSNVAENDDKTQLETKITEIEKQIAEIGEIVLDERCTKLKTEFENALTTQLPMLLETFVIGGTIGAKKSSVSTSGITTSGEKSISTSKTQTCDWTITYGGNIVLSKNAEKSTPRLFTFIESIPVLQHSTISKFGADWKLPKSATSVHSWCGKLKPILVANGYEITFGMVDKTTV